MAPNPKGIIRPRSKKMRNLISLSIARRFNPLHRPSVNILSDGVVEAPLRKGIPQLHNHFDTSNRMVTGFRKYTPPFNPKPPINRNYDETNYYEMKAKFRFETTGKFPQNGDLFRDDMIKTAKDLFLVGWIKCRSKFSIGHLQGDCIAVSQMRRWLEGRYSSCGRLDTIRIYNESFGIPILDYERLSIVQDLRRPSKKKFQLLQSKDKLQVSRWINDSMLLHEEESCMRNNEKQI